MSVRGNKKKATREEKKNGERGVVCQCYSTPKPPEVTPRHHPTQTLGDVQTEACLHHPSSGILLSFPRQLLIRDSSLR